VIRLVQTYRTGAPLVWNDTGPGQKSPGTAARRG